MNEKPPRVQAELVESVQTPEAEARLAQAKNITERVKGAQEESGRPPAEDITATQTASEIPEELKQEGPLTGGILGEDVISTNEKNTAQVGGTNDPDGIRGVGLKIARLRDEIASLPKGSEQHDVLKRELARQRKKQEKLIEDLRKTFRAEKKGTKQRLAEAVPSATNLVDEPEILSDISEALVDVPVQAGAASAESSGVDVVEKSEEVVQEKPPKKPRASRTATPKTTKKAPPTKKAPARPKQKAGPTPEEVAAQEHAEFMSQMKDGIGAERYAAAKEFLKEYRERMPAIRLQLTQAENALSVRDFEQVERYQEMVRENPLVSPEERAVVLSGNSRAYIEAFQSYKELQDRYVNNRMRRYISEQVGRTEEIAGEHEKGVFSKIRKATRWLGDQNANKLVETDSKLAKFALRMASARTAISGGLLAVGLFAAPLASVSLAARTTMSGAMAGFGSYDLMRASRENKTRQQGEDLVTRQTKEGFGIDINETRSMMVALEAQARFSGARVIHDPVYVALKKQLLSAIRQKERAGESLDGGDFAFLETQRFDVMKEERRTERDTKIKAAGVGVGTALLGRLFGGLFGGATQEASQGATEGMDIVPGGGDFGGAGAGAESVEVALPAEVLDVANDPEKLAALVAHQEERFSPLYLSSEDVVDVPDASPEDMEVGTDATPSETADASPSKPEAPESIPGSAVQTIEYTLEKGDSLWKAGKKMIAEGKITQEQFTKAWGNVNSVFKFESGTEVHMSELGLVHAGDQLVYVAEHNGTPGYFRVIDAAGELRVGTNEDLAAAFDAAGKPRPQWLVKALEAKRAMREALEQGVDVSQTANKAAEATSANSDIIVGTGTHALPEELLNNTAEAVPAATDVVVAESALAGQEIVENSTAGGTENGADYRASKVHELTIGETQKTKWGGIQFDVDSEGRIRGMQIIKDVRTPNQRLLAVRELMDAENGVALAGYKDVVDLPARFPATASFEYQMLEVSRYLDALSGMAPRSPEAVYLRSRVADIISFSWVSEEYRPNPAEVFKKPFLTRFKIPV